MTEPTDSLDPAAVGLPPRRAFPPFEALRAFDAVARLGGVRKAAHALLRDHAVVSRHLRTLETWTGMTLFERTPSGAVLTTQGRAYHDQVSVAIETIASATMDLLKRNEVSCVHVWCMPAFALHWMIGHLDSFQTKSNLDIELRATRELPDFDRQEADIAIHLVPAFGKLPQTSGLVQSIEIARLPTIAIASPEYLSGHKKIRSPKDLLNHELLHEEDFDSWQAWFSACGLDGEIELSGPRLWHGHMTMAAAQRGRGIALTNRLVAGEDIARGRLVQVGAGNTNFPLVTIWTYILAARTDRWDSIPIRSFREWLLEMVKRELPNGL